MRAVTLNKELMYTENHPPPKPKDGEALIRVTTAGLCNTDLEIAKGYMGFTGIPGHEFTGIVEECDDVRFKGRRVVGEINIGCGTCDYCHSGLENHCNHRSVLGILGKDGAFADFLTLPARNLHIIPDSLPDEYAVFIEPLAAALEITCQVELRPADDTAVVGDGKLGLLIGQALAVRGARLIVIGRHKEKLSILKNMGIEAILRPEIGDRKFDVVIDATGSAAGPDHAMELVRPRGRLVIKTTLNGPRQIDLNKVVVDEITIVGSRCGPFRPAIKALDNRSIDVKPLIRATYGLAEYAEAFKTASQDGVLKVLLKIA